MFGNPFKRDPSPTEFPNEKCRWCLARIGLVDHYPLPLCKACVRHAATHASPIFRCSPCWKEVPRGVGNPGPCSHAPADWPGNVWERMCDEFDRQMRKWCRRMRSSPTTIDVMSQAQEAFTEIGELRKAQKMAVLAGDAKTLARLEEEIQARTKALATFRVESVEAAKAVEENDKREEAAS